MRPATRLQVEAGLKEAGYKVGLLATCVGRHP